jgi:D-alanyl-D-alanine carboxypeptidase
MSAAIIPSDNDAARVLASSIGSENFVDLMNKKSYDLSLTNTFFANPTGLDPLEGRIDLNISTASDIATLVREINTNYRSIFEMGRTISADFCSLDLICHKILNTNQLLSDPEFLYTIIGGKTGQTDLAQRNLALIMEPIDGIFLISIVLGSTDHFATTKTLINSIKIKN